MGLGNRPQSACLVAEFHAVSGCDIELAWRMEPGSHPSSLTIHFDSSSWPFPPCRCVFMCASMRVCVCVCVGGVTNTNMSVCVCGRLRVSVYTHTHTLTHTHTHTHTNTSHIDICVWQRVREVWDWQNDLCWTNGALLGLSAQLALKCPDIHHIWHHLSISKSL